MLGPASSDDRAFASLNFVINRPAFKSAVRQKFFVRSVFVDVFAHEILVQLSNFHFFEKYMLSSAIFQIKKAVVTIPPLSEREHGPN